MKFYTTADKKYICSKVRSIEWEDISDSLKDFWLEWRDKNETIPNFI